MPSLLPLQHFPQLLKSLESGDYFDVCFYVDKQKIIEIGEKMNDINEYAYMNGYKYLFGKYLFFINNKNIARQT